MTDDERFLTVAIEEARAGRDKGGVPIGAALVVDGRVVGRGRNRRVQLGSAIRHGEMDALEDAGRLPAASYARATMYTTLSPCPMYSGAILLYGVPRVVLGENETFLGEEALLRSRGVEVVDLASAECRALMADFVAQSEPKQASSPSLIEPPSGRRFARRPAPFAASSAGGLFAASSAGGLFAASSAGRWRIDGSLRGAAPPDPHWGVAVRRGCWPRSLRRQRREAVREGSEAMASVVRAGLLQAKWTGDKASMVDIGVEPFGDDDFFTGA